MTNAPTNEIKKTSPFRLTLLSTCFTKEQVQTQMAALEEEQKLQIALAGRSNVGKSSLINALAGTKKLAKTSATPGKTRSINFYMVEPDGFFLVDLPGYGYAKCSREERNAWAKLIEYYLTSCPNLVGLGLLLDCRLSPQNSDKELAAFAKSHNIRLLPLLTKADKCTQNEQNKRRKEWALLLDGVQPLVLSAVKGRGIKELQEMLRSYTAITP